MKGNPLSISVNFHLKGLDKFIIKEFLKFTNDFLLR
jgi:hypothetical protein